MTTKNATDQRTLQLRRLRAELVRLRARQITLRGRVTSAAAMTGSRSGELGRQRKEGNLAPTAQKLQQEQEAVEKQIATTQQYIERLEAQLAAPGAAATSTDTDEVGGAEVQE